VPARSRLYMGQCRREASGLRPLDAAKTAILRKESIEIAFFSTKKWFSPRARSTAVDAEPFVRKVLPRLSALSLPGLAIAVRLTGRRRMMGLRRTDLGRLRPHGPCASVFASRKSVCGKRDTCGRGRQQKA